MKKPWPLTVIPIGVWLASMVATALPGWLIVRFLPTWLAMVLMILLTLVVTLAAVLTIAMAVPGSNTQIKKVGTLYSIMFGLVAVTPAFIAVKLFTWVA